MFNMSVGYDLAGIQSEKIDKFIESMKDASILPCWEEYKAVLAEYFPWEKEYIASISPKICSGVTLSTLHGCPPQEIERIASYLITENILIHSLSAIPPYWLRIRQKDTGRYGI